MLELALRQKEQFEQTVTELFEAARQHQAGTYVSGRLNQALDQLIGQIGAPVEDRVAIGSQKVGKRRGLTRSTAPEIPPEARS